MKRQNLGSLLALGLIVPAVAFASGRTSLGLSVNIGTPPPPVVVVREEPRCVVVPGSTVYVVRDPMPYDMFRYGVFWYVYQDDHWFRARSYRGPFTAIEVRHVPRAIITVPAKHWRHHPHGGPPGLAKKRGDAVVVRADDDVVVVKSKGKGKGHGR